MYDLHTHTTFSDGTTSPEDNVQMALEAGLTGLGVTDHDTAASWDRARKAAEGTGLEIVPGAELSAELDGYSVHVLGYWFDPDDVDLSAEMDRIANERDRRAEDIVRRFREELDIPVRIDRVRAIAGDAPLGRPHIATAVVETGAAEDISQVFDRWLHDGGPAYVPKYAVDPTRCVELIVSAGGVAVLAHPGLYGPSDEGRSGPGIVASVIEDMARVGLAGIEADHPDHGAEHLERYRAVARELDLVVIAGSDFHGDRKDLRIGEAVTSPDAVDLLRQRLPDGQQGEYR